eukprot:jgi/Hompol1/5774/HPOL_002057-RA
MSLSLPLPSQAQLSTQPYSWVDPNSSHSSLYSHAKIVLLKRSGQDGGSQDCDVRLHLPAVSQEHATITIDRLSGMASILDHSENGTTINGKDIRGLVTLQHGDIIGICERRFRFEYSSEFRALLPAGMQKPPSDKENTLATNKNETLVELIVNKSASRLMHPASGNRRTKAVETVTAGASQTPAALQTFRSRALLFYQGRQCQ